MKSRLGPLMLAGNTNRGFSGEYSYGNGDPPGSVEYGSASVPGVSNCWRVVKGWPSAVTFHMLPLMVP